MGTNNNRNSSKIISWTRFVSSTFSIFKKSNIKDPSSVTNINKRNDEKRFEKEYSAVKRWKSSIDNKNKKGTS